jgi:hypothetical protein
MSNDHHDRQDKLQRFVLGIIDLLELVLVKLREFAHELGAKDNCQREN